MMSQSTAAIHAQMTNGGHPRGLHIVAERSIQGTDATHSEFYCIGGCDAPGRARWVTVLASRSAAQQAGDILAAMQAG